MNNPVKYVILIPVIILCSVELQFLNGQNTEPDTVIIKRSLKKNSIQTDTMLIPGGRDYPQVIVGTTFIPSSQKMINLLNQGLFPVSFTIVSDCNNTTEPRTYKNYPTFKISRIAPNRLIIDVDIIANCCSNFLGEAEIIGKDTLNLLYTHYGAYCACSCRYSLRYIFNDFSKDHGFALKYITVNGSIKYGLISDKK